MDASVLGPCDGCGSEFGTNRESEMLCPSCWAQRARGEALVALLLALPRALLRQGYVKREVAFALMEAARRL
jgi:hypothetical protein